MEASITFDAMDTHFEAFECLGRLKNSFGLSGPSNILGPDFEADIGPVEPVEVVKKQMPPPPPKKKWLTIVL